MHAPHRCAWALASASPTLRASAQNARFTSARLALASRRPFSASPNVAPPPEKSAAAAAAAADSAAAPPPSPQLIYKSAEPQLVLWAARLLSLKAAACAISSAAILAPHVAALRLGSVIQLDAAVGSADARVSAALLAMAVLARAVSRRIANRTVTKLERLPAAIGSDSEAGSSAGVPPDASGPLPIQPAALAHRGDDEIRITRLALWRSLLPSPSISRDTVTVRRSAIACAPANTTFQCFLLTADPSSPKQTPQYLFPVRGTVRSTDLAYLKTMLFGDYFRPEPPLPPDTSLISIAGFGPYRPAQFADARHPLFPSSADLEKAAAAGGAAAGSLAPVRNAQPLSAAAPFFIRDGTVWSNFVLPPPPSLGDRRAAERDAKLYGAPAQPPRALATLAAPPSRMLDGSTRTVDYADVREHLKQQQAGVQGAMGNGQQSVPPSSSQSS